MSYVNLYKPPPPHGPTWGPDPYDINIVFNIDFNLLENDRLKLTPFIPAKHAQLYLEQSHDRPELYRFLPWQFPTLDDLLSKLEAWRLDPTWLTLVIIDKTRNSDDPSNLSSEGGGVAGIVALIHGDPHNLTVEIGAITILPSFQRTHVTTHMVGLLLHYCFSLPTADKPGLGLRRVQWAGNPANAPSFRVAKRFGFVKEGELRWTWVVQPDGKENILKARVGELPGRGSALYALCWDDWEAGAKETARRLMETK
ncbi:acyl-CoA N-acyltransferase [Gloeophyllum trabeum ATCC 11539]|uniref:Acyl-CoA N-acyltransferase n=1 Tax=Gloeophyllum trabeum (strain ATCC 11539 / FP-39264 / Madison 617) TaxID=670483 RepID=S7QBA7_GLOTA|nr:acyl-CoA N-acyltransferase [Gloeophyllum trabeum ATCC 11539]EPQ57226.1 acyl-CoA N-acyltransferase [Gloeophyllum trabeum ATCC 11539]